MDFYRVKQKSPKKGQIDVYPDFRVCRSKDLMVRAKSFYAIWNEEIGLWSTDEYDVQRIVDDDLYAEAEKIKFDGTVNVRAMGDFSSKSWVEFRNYVSHISDSNHILDNKLTFSNTIVKKEDYVSKRLPYPLKEGSIEAYEEIISTLYDPEDRAKLEWAIGSIVEGSSKEIQKFIVLYGNAGAGKSTVLNIIQKLFQGYYTMFEAKALTSNNNSFSTEVFKSNPLVAIQHDGDLSKIEDNTKLNSIVSHEEMVINEKFKPSYPSRMNCFLFMATNRPVKITDAKSGIIRRLIDVRPSGRLIEPSRYHILMNQVEFELGAIANHCLEVFRSMGKDYYNSYRPVDMMFKTDAFFNFVEDSYPVFKDQDGTSLKAAFAMYKVYCEDSKNSFIMPMYKFREELKNYFNEFKDVTRVDGKQVRSYFSGFKHHIFDDGNENVVEGNPESMKTSLVFDKEESIFDSVCHSCPAQYANSKGTPMGKWDNVKTVLSDIDTKKLHYVKVPENHIVIDFDLKGENGEKSFEKNLKAAELWPKTYGETSKSGKGIHLHYIYDGDVNKLSRVYDPEGIEIKVFTGNASLRRMLTKCNDIPIATISSGLPLKGGKKVINFNTVQTEKGLRTLIKKNLNKEIHPGTKPSVDFIHKILQDAYESGIFYDVTDLRPQILAFANNSTNQAEYCVKLVSEMKFKSDEVSPPDKNPDEDKLVFFDVEVFPNLFLVNWKVQGEGKTCVRMINPTPEDIEELLKFKLVGFNCRRYDNHILYARYIGYNNEQLYNLSQKIINGSKNAMFGEAYNLSYTDVYDFASSGNKKSLKKFEIELGIHHQELGLPWDKPVPEEKWIQVAEYCDNDVIATEAVFNHLEGDWKVRQILAELSGGTVNDSTNSHSTKIIFGKDPKPQSQFVYTDLSEMFPGYTFERGKSLYRGEDPSEGGYVYSEPGMYANVALLDIESMHPSSIENLNLFGDVYTKRFSDIKKTRLLIKHGDYNSAKKMLDGKLAPYLNDEKQAKELSNALKTVINSIYGLTSAKFDNKFRDPRNKDNIVAKRGALFMIDLKNAVQEQGYTVAHIKTDSIKIPNADDKIINFINEFGKKYGYNFEHEATYDKMCLVNDAVYIAKYKLPEGSNRQPWTATGAQFQHPYVFKTLFSHENLEFRDLCETKTVTTALYLDMNEKLGDDEHNYVFVGKAGSFCPINEGCGGGLLVRSKDIEQEDGTVITNYYAATGSKGYRWLESEVVETLGKEKDIDYRYFNALVDDAVANISKYGDFEWFISDDNDVDDVPPWEDVNNSKKGE